jgi:hypothetical protein
MFIDSKILELIGTFCRFLKIFESITSCFNNNEKHIHDFGLIFGQRLEYLRFDCMRPESLQSFLKSTNKLRALHIINTKLNANDLIGQRFSKIDEIGFKFSDLQNMVSFTDHFYAKIKKICIHFRTNDLNINTINDSLLQITHFKLLEYLELDFVNYRQFNSSIDDSLRTIAKKLLKLKYLHLKSFTTTSNLKVPQQDTIKGDLFPILGQFKTIEYLKIRHSSHTQRFGSIECFKGCKSLKHLRIKSFRYFSDKEFEEYKLHLSGLKSLIINCFNRNFSLRNEV